MLAYKKNEFFGQLKCVKINTKKEIKMFFKFLFAGFLIRIIFADSFAIASPVCTCILLKDCQPFTRLLLNHAPEQKQEVVALIRNAVCGFHYIEPLTCCPSTSVALPNMRTTRFASNNFDISSEVKHALLTEAPWVWERGPLLSRFSKSQFENENNEKHILDYKDYKSQLNCPKTFAGDVRVNTEFEDYSRNLHVAPHRHHHIDYHIEHDESDEEPEARNIPEDRPIVFPSDLRFQKPVTATRIETNSSTRPPMNMPNCGSSLTLRIIGGDNSMPGQYPWITRLAYRNKTDQSVNYRCAGSVISNQFALTAAHCVTNLVSDIALSHIRIGDDLEIDCDASTPNCKVPNIFAIINAIPHPNYDKPKFANDIALIRFNNLANTIFTSICLPLNFTNPLGDRLFGQIGIAAGWSSASIVRNVFNTTVKHLRLPIVNTTECAATYARYSENFKNPIVIRPSHLCAQGQIMNDVCRGDSGGPLMDDGTSGIVSKNGRYTLLGIVAFGPTLCGGSTTIPGVYTRVDSYIDWIFSNIQ